MSKIAISAEGVGKQYRLGEVGTGTISHDLNRWWARLRGKEDPFARIGEANDRTTKGESDYVWALKEIDFKVAQGDVVGIIGRNGAGKSTLLKILSKVTSPTTGRIRVNGRIAALLEVGTGFHPDLTGRENIFLNGAILGMTRAEISRNFDEIVAFAGVERYIDTPVKRYSSGMYVRLAFAVSAFLEPEILIVDEVLAVGDAEFQKKCLGKMGDINRESGRTILFVSHNMSAMQKLCNTGILMSQGRLSSMGRMNDIINEYMSVDSARSNERLFKPNLQLPASVVRVTITDEDGNQAAEVGLGTKWTVNVFIKVNETIDQFISAVGLVNPMEMPINTSWQPPRRLTPGVYCASFSQHEVQYAIGRYKIVIGLSIGVHNFQSIEDAIDLNIVSLNNDNSNLIKVDASTSAILNQLQMETVAVADSDSWMLS